MGPIDGLQNSNWMEKGCSVNVKKVSNMTMDYYHQAPAVGSSSIRTLIQRSPAHYLYEKTHPSESTPTQLFGQLIHSAILEPKLFEKDAIVKPEFSGAGSRAKSEEWHLEHHGKMIMKREQFDCVQGILKSIKDHPLASKIVGSGRQEESIFWTDPETGIECKARFDFLHDGQFVVDVKTTLDASYAQFRKDIANYGYHIQAAHYLEAAQLAYGANYDKYLILAPEREAPHCVSLFILDENAIAEGRALRLQALKTLANCIKSGIFPGYPQQIINIDLPTWGYKAEEP